MSSNDADDLTTGSKNVDLLPVLIIPGFMSSGLIVKQSDLRPDWISRRIWINLASLGFQSIQFGKKPSVEKEPDAQHTEYKSDWLKHMSLGRDLQTERHGIKLRSIPGLQGVDYLTPGTLTNHVSYVFGPVIRALVKAGYREEVNLDAMSYDWRIPPTQMEARDQYFSRAIQRVERMYHDNDETPVVIMCHSLGCKVGHYFLNFCLDTKGQEWLDRYIHTYMPVGGPHLGAPKALRSVISGDKMGLDTFLSDQEALAFGRSLGSGPWLFPGRLAPGVPSCLYYHPQGVLEVSVTSPINLKPMLKYRRVMSKTKKFKLSLVYGKTVVTTDYHIAENESIQFHEVFAFATSSRGPMISELKGEECLFQVLLLEPGISAAKHEKKKRNCLCQLLCCPLKLLCILPILFYCMVKHVTILSAEAVSRAVGASTIIAASRPTRFPDAVSNGAKRIQVGLYYGDDRDGGGSCKFWTRPHPERITLTMTWKPPQSSQVRQTPVIAAKDARTQDPEMVDGRTECSGLLNKEGLDDILNMMRSVYDTDPLGPREGRSSTEAPPVKRIKAIYGTNLSTEIGGVYCRRPGAIVSNTENRFELDKDAKLSRRTLKAGGHVLKGGVLYETRKKKQADGSVISGDGTVPYYSLSYVKTWNDDCCQVDVSEIDKAEHREILADPRFHEILIEYVSTGAKVSSS